MSILLKGRSPLGAFIRSPLGVKGAGGKKNASMFSDGIATASISQVNSIGLNIAISSTRLDSTYPTIQTGTISSSTSPSALFQYGKASSGANIARGRMGISIPLASSYPGSTKAFILFSNQFSNYTNALDSTWNPKVYVCNTDVSSLMVAGTKANWDWETHTDTFIADLPFGVNANMRMPVPFARVSAQFGGNLCFIVVNNLELLGAGNATPSGTNASAFNFNFGAGGLVRLQIT